MRKNEAVLLVLLFAATAFIGLRYFGRSYPTFPDSEKYLLLVSAFRGEIPLNETIAPFSYRPLIPGLAAIQPFDPALFIATLNFCLLFVLAYIMYRIPKDFGFGPFSSVVAAGLCMVSWPVMQYGSAVLVETPFMVMLALGVYAIMKKWSFETILFILVLGVAIKETALLLALVWFLQSERPRLVLVASTIPVMLHLFGRFVFRDTIGGSSWTWDLGATNLLRPYAALDVFFFALFLVIIPVLAAVYFRKRYTWFCMENKYLETVIWFIGVGIPLGLLIPITYFFAYFSVRFVWPMYLGLLPIMSLGVQRVLDQITDLELGAWKK